MINTVSEQICLFLFEIKPIVHFPVLLCIIHFYHTSYIKAKYIQAVVILMILIILWFTHCILRNTIVLVFFLQKFSYLKIYLSIMMLYLFIDQCVEWTKSYVWNERLTPVLPINFVICTTLLISFLCWGITCLEGYSINFNMEFSLASQKQHKNT